MKILEEGKISGSQFMWLLVTTVLPTAVLFIPAISIKHAGTAAWMEGLITVTLWGLVIVHTATTLGERFPGRSPVDYAGEILGKLFGKLSLGKVVGLFYMFIFTYVNAIIVREFGEFLVTAFMPETPLIVFNIVLLLLAASAVRNGIEVLARMNQFVVSLMFFALVFIFSLVFRDVDLRHLLPFLEEGWRPVLRGSLTPMGWRGETFLLLFLMPYLNNYREARYASYKAIFLLGFILGIDVFIVLAVFGQQAENMVFPVHHLATYISVGGFLERVEAFILALWVSGVMVKVAIWYYCATIVTAQTFNLRDYKPVVIPLGVIQAVWSVTIYGNIREMVEFFDQAWITFSLFFEFIVPSFLLLMAIIRRKGAGRSER